jgi:hypothetical protein
MAVVVDLGVVVGMMDLRDDALGIHSTGVAIVA